MSSTSRRSSGERSLRRFVLPSNLGPVSVPSVRFSANVHPIRPVVDRSPAPDRAQSIQELPVYVGASGRVCHPFTKKGIVKNALLIQRLARSGRQDYGFARGSHELRVIELEKGRGVPKREKDIVEPCIAVVIPCYRESTRVLGVIGGVGDEVRHIIVIDDACPDGTGEAVRTKCSDPRVEVITHKTNTGVGGSTLTGYARALEIGADIIVKVDGDGQMDPALIPRLIAPITDGNADYVKGNRFLHPDGPKQMPTVRVIGNLGLSFLSKVSTGYWDIFDPTNGFTAIHAKVAARLPVQKISRGYFFETDMLFRLNIMRAVVADLPMAARYADEQSGIRIGRAIFEFAGKNFLNAIKRIFVSYFVRDFSVVSLQLVLGKLLFLFGVVFGGLEWRKSVTSGVPATAGTVILAALPIIVGVQMGVAFLNYDIRNVPKKPIHLIL
ncbi:MAG: glycosyltransferase family 2 protein [Rhodospirillales bacterium]|nr:glycosyltransferase family 2 protein [Rhodospirillales bacterium]